MSAAALFVLAGWALLVWPAYGQNTKGLQEWYEEGEKALAEKRLDAAASAYRNLERARPDLAEVHAKLGLIFYLQGKFAQAAPQFEEALRIKPGLERADRIAGAELCGDEQVSGCTARPGEGLP